MYTILILLGIGNKMLFKNRKSCSCGEIKRKWARTNLNLSLTFSKFDTEIDVTFVIRIYSPYGLYSFFSIVILEKDKRAAINNSISSYSRHFTRTVYD